MKDKAEAVEASLIEAPTALEIDAGGVQYRELNNRLRKAAVSGVRRIVVRNVQGQRYLGTGLDRSVELDVHGHPGDDLGAFIDGPCIDVRGDVRDGCGHTMRGGEIVIHGRAGDILAWSARGGRILVRDDVGRRAGIRMTGGRDGGPVVVIGGTAQGFLAEYMAGGVLVLLGLTLKDGQPHAAGSIGNGMQGGMVLVRGTVEDRHLGREVARAPLDESDRRDLRRYVAEFAHRFGLDAEAILEGEFTKLVPVRLGPRGRLYAH